MNRYAPWKSMSLRPTHIEGCPVGGLLHTHRSMVWMLLASCSWCCSGDGTWGEVGGFQWEGISASFCILRFCPHCSHSIRHSTTSWHASVSQYYATKSTVLRCTKVQELSLGEEKEMKFSSKDSPNTSPQPPSIFFSHSLYCHLFY